VGLVCCFLLKPFLIPSRKNRERPNFYEFLQQSLQNSTEATLNNATTNLRVVDFITSWANYERYPIVQMEQVENSSTILLYQVPNKFLEETCTYLKIPVSYTNNAGASADSVAVWMQNDFGNQTAVENAIDLTNPGAWVVFNPEGIGYYRVNYDEPHWQRLTAVLYDTPQALPYVTRAVLVDDILNLARFGMVDYTVAFHLVGYLKLVEPSFHPWKAALENLKFVYKMLEDQSNFHVIENFLASIIRPEFDRQSKAETENTEIVDAKEQQRISELILEWACQLDFPACVDKMKKDFLANVGRDGELRPPSKSQKEIYLTVCNSLRYGGNYEFGITLNTVYSTADIVYQRTLLRSLGCTREVSLIGKFLRLLTQPTFSQLYDDILHSISDNPVAVKMALDHWSKNWIVVKRSLTMKQTSIVFQAISNENEFNLVRNSRIAKI
jgi:aminopeptidase N